MTKRFLSCLLALVMVFSMSAIPAFAQEVPAATAENATRAVTLPSNATYINDTGDVRLSTSSNTTAFSLYLPSYVSYLYVELCVYDRGNPNAYYSWQVKRPNSSSWENLESMCIADNSSCIEAITSASAGTYSFRVTRGYGATSNANNTALVCFWK